MSHTDGFLTIWPSHSVNKYSTALNYCTWASCWYCDLISSPVPISGKKNDLFSTCEERQITNKKTVASTPCEEKKETLIQNLIRFSEYFEPKSDSLLYNTFIQVGVVLKGLLSKMMTDILTVYLWAEVNSRIICIRWWFLLTQFNILLILILTLLKEPSPWSFYCQFLHFSQYQPLILYCYISA